MYINETIIEINHFENNPENEDRAAYITSPAVRQLRHIRNSVPTATFQSLVVALVLSRLDYENSVLVGLAIHLVRRLRCRTQPHG